MEGGIKLMSIFVVGLIIWIVWMVASELWYRYKKKMFTEYLRRSGRRFVSWEDPDFQNFLQTGTVGENLSNGG